MYCIIMAAADDKIKVHVRRRDLVHCKRVPSVKGITTCGGASRTKYPDLMSNYPSIQNWLKNELGEQALLPRADEMNHYIVPALLRRPPNCFAFKYIFTKQPVGVGIGNGWYAQHITDSCESVSNFVGLDLQTFTQGQGQSSQGQPSQGQPGQEQLYFGYHIYIYDRLMGRYPLYTN